ncbi:MAG TPA: bifunctional glutamate N-acetyltransferase/amino-acid acetyltransferase ArgJ [Humisphaera sp.]|jgi:glutamate N-acetyltransferase/amino-acid N-acetyltransferase|nr:bifunctional glutamate N-acetyltransferase/amino-acid acetyltransferase ArgJ [Humisphaera sp.]
MATLHLLSPRGFRATGLYAGIKSRNAPDIGLLVCETRAAAAAVFTTNKVVAAGVKIGRRHIADGRLRGVVVNSGNANACTGRRGERDAMRMCQLAAEVIDCPKDDVLCSSTGIIGHHLPMEKIDAGILDCGKYLGDSLEHALLFADAILTTDTKRKAAAVEFKIGRDVVSIAGVCKGSGMIGPRLALHSGSDARKVKHATMLAYLTTDALISPTLLRKLIAQAVQTSFNTVTVDDHASTNDTAAILASGASAAKIDSAKSIAGFTKGLDEVCQSLAYQIAADGEGATKVVVVKVIGAASEEAARAMARTIANSPLVKCAMNGNDPNWGRIVSAAGFAGVPFDPDRCALKLQGTTVFRNGQPVPFDAAKVSEALRAKEVTAELICRGGKGTATVWTCDLSKDYVTINADYHT